jgi:hypothetical protein
VSSPRTSWALSASADAGSGESSDEKNTEGRKNRVVLGYKAMLTSYLAAGTMSVTRSSGFSSSLLRVIAGYIVMPAGLSYILISAAANNRLGSDTYKRLNLSMLGYSGIGLAVVKLSKGRNQLLALALILSLINCTKGYVYGVLGWDKKNDTSVFNDITKGSVDSVKGFFSIPKNFASFGYQVALIMVAYLKIERLLEVLRFIKASSIDAQGLAMPLARLNRLVLMSLCLYTLKDAAERDRLGGTTFIELNLICSLSLAAQFLFDTGGVTTPVGVLSGFFAVFCALNGIGLYLKKG